jgi:alpha-D-xyloside xylohydrolase
VDQKPADPLEVRVYPGADGSFILYEDAGDSYDYEHGAYTAIPFHWNDASKTLRIGKRTGAYEGMLKDRTFRIVLVDGRHGGGVKESAGARVAAYSGEEVRVKLP